MYQPSFYHMRALPLDCLRIILCLLVVDYHYGKIFHAGGIAVMGFFVLAGYFLEREFEKDEQLNLPLFFRKKAIHLLPEYLTISIPSLLITLYFPQIYSVDFSQAREASFTLIQLFETANNPSWFLTNLFLFIAFAPILFCFHRARWGIALAFSLAFLYRIILQEAYGSSIALYTAAQANISFFLGGMLARQIYCKVRVSSQMRGIMLATVAIGFFVIFHELRLHKPWAALVQCLLFMTLVPLLHVSSTTVPRYLRFIVWLSSLTYAMYLFHAPIKRACICVLNRTMGEQVPHPLNVAHYFVFLLLTILAAALFQYAKTRLLKRFITQ